jgi:hypothetical protein
MVEHYKINDIEFDDIPRWVIVDVVELYDSEEGDWLVRHLIREKKD